MWQYSIQRHQDNDYDLIITILPENVEFGSDLFSAERKESVQRSLQSHTVFLQPIWRKCDQN